MTGRVFVSHVRRSVRPRRGDREVVAFTLRPALRATETPPAYRTSAISLALVLALLAALPAAAQVTTCKTSNCAAGSAGSPVLPPECQSLASPRLLIVNMDSTTLRFIPANPRLEGMNSTPGAAWDYQCIQWHKVGSTLVPWHSATEDDATNTCNTATACSTTNVYPNPCSWETGNINNSGTPNLEYSTCHYRDIAAATYHYRCRLHVASGMVGALQIVPPIQLRVTKQGAQVVLSWPTGGSTAGPWEVFRSPNADMPAATTTNLTPAGTAVRTLTDTPPAGNLFAYMVRERN